MTTATLPTPMDVRTVLEGLLGRDVELNVESMVLSHEDHPVVATYADDMGRIACCAAVDLPLAVYLGAAVALAPPAGAREMAADGELTPMFAENLYEVFNIFSSMFRNDVSDQVRLAGMSGPGDALPPLVGQWLSSPVGRLDLAIEVSGYGSGHLVLATGV